MMSRFMGPLVCAGLIVLWWLLLSRASLKEKALGLIGLVTIVIVTTLLADKSIRGIGTMIFAVPWGISGFAVALICLARAKSTRRTWLALLAALVCFGFWDLVRADDWFAGSFRTVWSWRWEPTAEDRLLQSIASRSRAENPASADVALRPLAEPEWPGFRGPHRRGVQPGIVLGEDWDVEPPREVWRVAVGPGWSSFSVAGNRLFTQEQRGEYEVVVCYDADSGAEIWVHQDKSRFWEAIGGAGPRATPTLSDGSLFALGATGILHRLDPLTGDQVWQRDINIDAGREPPTWGYASSPLITDSVVIVYAGGPKDKGVLAYDVDTGEPRWSSPAGDQSYSSPQLSELCGISSILMLTNEGLTFVDSADGTLLGKHDWEFQGYRVVQPLVVADSSVLLGTAMGTGTQRIEVSLDGRNFATREGWISRRMNPYYNDYVAHNGYLYGFDNNIFACVDLTTGERKWKKGRYGNGQVLLLPDRDQLLVISEDGELVLLRATPEKLIELARHRVFTGRTWNHPVLVGNRVYVRNGEEAACFEVPTVMPTRDRAVKETGLRRR
jgi:outer membrane protein assembly factor BamB